MGMGGLVLSWRKESNFRTCAGEGANQREGWAGALRPPPASGPGRLSGLPGCGDSDGLRGGGPLTLDGRLAGLAHELVDGGQGLGFALRGEMGPLTWGPAPTPCPPGSAQTPPRVHSPSLLAPPWAPAAPEGQEKSVRGRSKLSREQPPTRCPAVLPAAPLCCPLPHRAGRPPACSTPSAGRMRHPPRAWAQHPPWAKDLPFGWGRSLQLGHRLTQNRPSQAHGQAPYRARLTCLPPPPQLPEPAGTPPPHAHDLPPNSPTPSPCVHAQASVYKTAALSKSLSVTEGESAHVCHPLLCVRLSDARGLTVGPTAPGGPRSPLVPLVPARPWKPCQDAEVRWPAVPSGAASPPWPRLGPPRGPSGVLWAPRQP